MTEPSWKFWFSRRNQPNGLMAVAFIGVAVYFAVLAAISVISRFLP
jgi:hypothetical protein